MGVITDPLELEERSRERLALAGHEFLAEFLRVETMRNPHNLEALAELGHVLTRMGRLDEGLDVDRRLVRMAPDNSTVHYNLGCSLSLLGRYEDALDALEHAVTLGYSDPEHMLNDVDLSPMRELTRFKQLLRQLREGSTY